mmetsp:Transcript_2938/g.4454  ORF Transcript_2938/g.4454 Transcript_2938/m.4454 type:complete len:226 (+) Transcript_2938:77-754(+)
MRVVVTLSLLLYYIVLSVSAERKCTVTGEQPSEQRGPKEPNVALSFCSMFRTNACCDPAVDAEIQGYYDDLVGVSELCASVRTKAHIALQYIFCYACSPKEPQYTRNGTITLCSGIAFDADPANFDDCGIVIPGNRGELCSGDDGIIPSNYYAPGGTTRDRLLEFFNDEVGGIPPYFEDYHVEICEESDDECNANCYEISGARTNISYSLWLGVSIVLFSLCQIV